MLLKESKEKILKAYEKGDLEWLNTINEEINKYCIDNIEQIKDLIKILYKLNPIVNDIIMKTFLNDYNESTEELYCKLKYELTIQIGYTEMWEKL